jgi:hypothetical protein
MIGNPDYKNPSALKDCFDVGGSVLALFGDIGLMVSMASFSRGWSQAARLGALALVATVLSGLSFAISVLEMALNFGDNDLPPYQPDTPFEVTFNYALFVVTIGAAVVWSAVIFQVVAFLFRFFRRCMTLRPSQPRDDLR